MTVISTLLLLLAAGAAPAAEGSGQWLQLRGDRHMSGRADGTGRMTDGPPAEAWRHDIAAWEGYASVRAGAGDSVVPLPFPGDLDAGWIWRERAAWGLGPQLHDLAGDGTLVPMPVYNLFKVAAILPGVAGLQRFEMGDSFSDGGAEPKRGRLLAYDTGEPRVVWETEPFENTWAPNVIVVDADADGQLDLAVTTHYRILVFDGATGETMMQSRYHEYRNYGLFAAADIDDDPYPEFAVVADFSMHAEVIDNDGRGLTLLWIREIQPDPSQTTKVVRPRPSAFLDADGDGAVEVVYSVYDDTGDRRWHTIAVDALSGETVHDFPGWYLHGLHDIDADGQPEWFLSRAEGEALPPYAPLSVRTLDGGGYVERWNHDRAAFSSRPLTELPLTVNTSASDGLRTAVTGDGDGDGRADFFVVTPAGEGEALTAWGAGAGGAVRALWTLQGPVAARLRAEAVASRDGGPATLAWWQGRGGGGQSLQVEGAGARLHQFSRQAFTAAGTPVVADLDGDGRVEVVVQTANEEVLCLEAPGRGDGEPRVRWQMQGHGQTNSAPWHWGVVASDLDGDGSLETLFAREAPGGNASLAAVTAAGEVLWQTVFDGFDGSMPIWNFSGLSWWNAGDFRGPGRKDVFVSLRRGKIGSEVGFLLDGGTGAVVWERNGYTLSIDGSGRSLGGHPSAAGDVDGDGLEEIVIMWPDRLHVVDGVTGDAQVVRQAYGAGLSPMFSSDGFVGYAFPAVVDLFGDAAPELIWGHNSYLNAVLSAAGEVWWQTEYRNNTQVQSLMAPGDADGDGDLELLASTEDGVQLLEPADGTVLRVIDLGPATTDVVSGDLDGDGRDEFLLGFGGRRWALPGDPGLAMVELEEGDLRQAWTLETEGRPSDPALADVDADGFLDLAATTTDGYVKVWTGGGSATAVSGLLTSRPEATRLDAPWPNPFNHRVTIGYRIERGGPVRLEVFSMTGQRLLRLVDGWRPAGDHRALWDGLDARGRPLASGAYVVRLRSGQVVDQRKIALLK
ncbi:MAG: FG-GAP-like repeat-containing protein [Gemmatimonadaceae bacterium]|nr:FG-GAP-like repeat-containing protein [Gemmatimonadaceae bacterium]